MVAERIEAAGGKVLVKTDTWVEFEGLDATEDPALIDEPETNAAGTSPTAAKTGTEEWKQRILSFDLSQSTPLQALNFLAEVQSGLKTSF